MKTAIRIFAFLLLALPAMAATYYVSPSGNNGNSGLSPGTAWLTLQHSSNTVVAGDSVIVMPGNYTGFYHTTSGTAAQRIVFFAQPGVLINAPNATTPDGINLESASYVVIDGFHVYGMPRTGIRSVLNDHVIIRNNLADSCFKWGILTGFSDDILIEGNECSRSVDEHGIYFSNSADNPVIRNNLCWGNNACGIHMNGDISLGGDGIISNALVENNILHGNGVNGGSAINCDGVQNSRIQNNLIYNNHASGISLYMIDGGGGSSGNVVVNNTILQPSDGRWALNISDGSINNLAFNNILYSSHAFRGSISIDALSLNGFHSNHNIVTDRMSNDGGSTVMTFAAWRAATQNDSISLSGATPADLFINAAGNDYHLQTISPARDWGRATYYSAAAPLNDIEMLVRPQGISHDAGCYEYQEPFAIAESALPVSWLNKISPNEKIVVYDLSGRLIYSGIMSELSADILPRSVFIICTVGREKTLKTYLTR